MKIHWLNPSRTQARLIKGWFTKYEAVVELAPTESYCTWCEKNHRYWVFSATGRATLNSLTHKLNDEALEKPLATKEWVKIDPLPDAVALDHPESGMDYP